MITREYSGKLTAELLSGKGHIMGAAGICRPALKNV